MNCFPVIGDFRDVVFILHLIFIYITEIAAKQKTVFVFNDSHCPYLYFQFG